MKALICDIREDRTTVHADGPPALIRASLGIRDTLSPREVTFARIPRIGVSKLLRVHCPI